VTVPTFLVIGAAKSGTTSLYHYLRQHPEIFVSPVKEPQFFAFEGMTPDFRGPGDEELNASAVTSIEEYEALFAGHSNEKAVGEMSQFYLYCDGTTARVRRRLPDVKLVVVLRDPAERAFSHYLMKLRLGVEPLASFEDALEVEKDRIRTHWSPGWHYGERGFYYRQLAPYFSEFDRRQIAVYLYEDLAGRPLEMLADLFRFLEVDDTFVPDVSARHNEARSVPRSDRLESFLTGPNTLRSAVASLLPVPVRRRVVRTAFALNRARPAASKACRERLRAAYRDDILLLEGLIDRDLSPWLRP